MVKIPSQRLRSIFLRNLINYCEAFFNVSEFKSCLNDKTKSKRSTDLSQENVRIASRPTPIPLFCLVFTNIEQKEWLIFKITLQEICYGCFIFFVRQNRKFYFALFRHIGNVRQQFFRLHILIG